MSIYTSSHKKTPQWPRWIYSAALYPLVPLVLLYLLWRARKQPEYAKHWGERFALYDRSNQTSTALRRVWVHAVSLGETRAAAPLIKALYVAQPDVFVILTHTTPTGRAAGQALFAEELAMGRMQQVYVPYDLYDVVLRFFKRFQPTDIWVMETEVWPNMLAWAQQFGARISLVNGRLSEKSFNQTLKLPRLMRAAYQGFDIICAQTETDAARYSQLGVSSSHLVVTGNLKFDMKASMTHIHEGERFKRLIGDRPVVLLSSTREGEEALWLAALPSIISSFPDNTQWWVVPRHPQRFDDVANLLIRYLLKIDSKNSLVRKSELDALSNDEACRARLQSAQIVLGDTMGQMDAYYTLADIVMMGGAWLALGGQNFLEPLALGKPTVTGTHTHNFAQIATDAQAAGALIVCEDITQGLIQAVQLLKNPELYRQYQEKAKAFGLTHQGAVDRTLTVLQASTK